MRIAFVYSGYSHRITSGIIIQLNAMMEFFRSRGHDVVFYPVREVSWLPIFTQLVFRAMRPTMEREFSDWLHTVQPDVVVTQGIHMPESRALVHLRPESSWKFILIQHGFPDRWWVRPFVYLYMCAIGRRILATADHTVVISHFTAHRVREYGGKHITLIPLGIDLHTFRPLSDIEKARTRRRFNLRVPLVLGIGRFIFLKNFETLIHAMREVPEAHCFLVGGGFNEQALRLLARTFGLGRRIRFFRRLRRDDLIRLYNIADVFALPSLAEGLGLVYIESLACGTPVIGSKLEGIRDIIENGKNGFYLNDPKDAHELAQHINRVLGDPTLRKKMSTYGIRSVHRKFNRDRLLLQLEKVIKTSCK